MHILFSLATGIMTVLTVHAGVVFNDVSENHWAYGYVQFISDNAVMTGYDDGTFGPDNTLTRAESLKVILGAQSAPLPESDTSTFPDVPDDHSLRLYIEAAAAKGIVTGYEDGTFRPEAPVTRAEFTKVLMNAAEEVDNPFRMNPPFSDVPKDAWFAPFVYSASERTYLNGFDDGSFKPHLPITRSHAAKITSLYINRGVIPDAVIPAQSETEERMFTRINESLAGIQKEPYALNLRMSLIAREHALALSNEYRHLDKVQWEEDNPNGDPPWISHVYPKGKSFEERFRERSEQAGVAYSIATENIAWATFRSRTVNEALDAMYAEMMSLPEPANADQANQKSNILGLFNTFTEVGIGIVIDTEEEEITMVQHFIET
jgi:hypothetical protein